MEARLRPMVKKAKQANVFRINKAIGRVTLKGIVPTEECKLG
jgi:hypothetical protein